MMADVAAGMNFLGKHGVVHKQLRAKCILVSDQFTVKISEYFRANPALCMSYMLWSCHADTI